MTATMQNPSEIMTRTSTHFVNYLAEEYGIYTSVMILCNYNEYEKGFRTNAWTKNKTAENQRLADALANTQAPALTSESRREKRDATISLAPLTDYFTAENRAASRFLQIEEQIIVTNGISIEEGWFLTIPIPVGHLPVDMVRYPVYKDESTARKVYEVIKKLENGELV